MGLPLPLVAVAYCCLRRLALALALDLSPLGIAISVFFRCNSSRLRAIVVIAILDIWYLVCTTSVLGALANVGGRAGALFACCCLSTVCCSGSCSHLLLCLSFTSVCLLSTRGPSRPGAIAPP